MVGLQEYHARRFDDVPDSCKSFKRILVAEKDVIGEFLSLTVEAHDDAKNFVRLRELYNEFQEVNKGLQRDKRSHKSYNTFKSAALQHLTGNIQGYAQLPEGGRQEHERQFHHDRL